MLPPPYHYSSTGFFSYWSGSSHISFSRMPVPILSPSLPAPMAPESGLKLILLSGWHFRWRSTRYGLVRCAWIYQFHLHLTMDTRRSGYISITVSQYNTSFMHFHLTTVIYFLRMVSIVTAPAAITGPANTLLTIKILLSRMFVIPRVVFPAPASHIDHSCNECLWINVTIPEP